MVGLQYEGAAKEGGRGPSIWDTFTHQHPNKIKGGANGDVAVDQYHLYKEDVRVMKDLGLDAYRFSVSWSRILPTGKVSGGINKVGITYYNNLINELLSKGLKPFVTLFHWDLPETLESEYGGFRSKQIAFMDPLTKGDYPEIMKSLVGSRLPRFTKQEAQLVKGSYDFLGLNYYTTYYASNYPAGYKVTAPSLATDSRANISGVRNGKPIGRVAASYWLYMYPKGLKDLLLYIKDKYNDPKIFITENGYSEANNSTLPLVEALKDPWRIEYLYGHLYYLNEAIREGADVRGYFAWSLLDNFEWGDGYSIRFGLVFIDYNNGLKRHPKHSAYWLQKFLHA